MSSKKVTRHIKSLAVKELIDDYIYRIDLDADYQREKIWSKKDQENLLDSIIRNIDIPKLYLAEVRDNKQFDLECIDGKQRMITLLDFFKPDRRGDSPGTAGLQVEIAGDKYTYKALKSSFPAIAKRIDDFELTFVIYKDMDDDEFVRLIFRRLQLGVRLNSGELLKTYSGPIRDFIYKEIGNNGPFFRHTNLSEKRFSRPFTLAQICINSFKRQETGDFVRARLDDIQEFFEEHPDLDKNDNKLNRIRKVLKEMDNAFGDKASTISSRAIAVSAYLFVEDLYLKEKTNIIPEFAKFFLKLLDEIKNNMKLISSYQTPKNDRLMEEFQKYVLQASVEPYSIRRRHEFLGKAFEYYGAKTTRGQILGNK